MSLRATGTDIGPAQFWQCLGERPVGVTVVTTSGPNGKSGFLGLSFAHVSAAPPVVLVSVGPNTSALDAIAKSGVFAVNLLPAPSDDIAQAFGGARATDERFDLSEWTGFVTGAPVLETASAVFDCTVISSVMTHGTTTFFGSVVGVRTGTENPLVAYRGRYSGYSE
ncbi:flavin reductase family protein [Arenibacterium halophilum]|uniref:Flavin reductase n=1 Tax=Arenibacterium halophilum TaxID=2583821 RepID=A0ABY2X0H1_9RHOB|nr:flavin reductase family protein [Arenibacterium halophilum]TMV08376.1 flavin reductase [Arenibacterium halophilum]